MSTSEIWAGDRAERWIRMSAGLERQLAPVSDLLFERAGLVEGARVLDVGCGTGPTTRQVARLVGPTGSVTGLDLVSDMIDAARDGDSGDDTGAAPIDWVAADATTWDGPNEGFDAVVSRFGVMFFEDPAAAFANLARMTAAGGRLHVAVWADRARSPFFEVPLAAATQTMRAELGLDPILPPSDAGPFSLGRRATVEPMLQTAGWTDIAWEEHVVALTVGGGQSPDDAAAGSMDLGPVRLVTAELDDEQTTLVRDAITTTFESHRRDGHVVLDGTVIVISALRRS